MSVNKVKQLDLNKIYCGDSLEVLKKFTDGSVDCIITSPPYWGLREYGWIGVIDKKCKHEKKNNVCIKCGAKYLPDMIGLETTIKEFVNKMVKIFTECKRVLAEYGTLWINFGDTYSSGSGNRTQTPDTLCKNNIAKSKVYVKGQKVETNIQTKSMCMVPERLAIRLVDDGWVLRNKIIWHKPSVVPQSARDRFTNDWEYMYSFTKKPKGYYFEQQFEECASGTPQAENDRKRMLAGRKTYGKGKHNGSGLQTPFVAGSIVKGKTMRNKRAVWKINSQAVKEAHFATFPFKLIETPIKAGCPELVCTGKKQPVTKKVVSRPAEKFNIRIRDVQDGKIKHTDRIASDDEVENYNEVEQRYVGKQRDWNIQVIDGCGQPVRKEFEMDVKKGSNDYDPKKYNGKDEKRHFDKNKDVRTIKSTNLIDGCGKPVIPEIEMVKEKTKIRPESGYKRVNESVGTGRASGEWDNEIRTPVRKPTTTSTHCSCGSPFRKGIVLDIFMGSGTTAIVARALGRDWVGIELNPEFIKFAQKRLHKWPPVKVLEKLKWDDKDISKKLTKDKRGLLKGL